MEIQSSSVALERLKPYFPFSVLVALFLAQLGLAQLLARHETPFIPLPMQQEKKWNPILFKSLSFGQHSTAVDWLLIRFLSDPALRHVSSTEHPPAYYDLDLATDIDPLFFELYWAGAYKLAIVRDDVKGAETLIQKGIRVYKNTVDADEFKHRVWSRVWELYQVLGYIYAIEYGDLPKAAEVFKEAAQLPNSPAYLQDLGKKFSKIGGAYSVGVTLINAMLRRATSDAEKRSLILKRRSLFLGQYFYQLSFEFRNYLHSLSEYRKSLNMSAKQIEKYYKTFARENRIPSVDEWGGRIYLTPDGKITSTTPRQKVMGLE